MIKTQVLLTPEQIHALRFLAEKQGKSVSELIRNSVDTMLRSSKYLDETFKRERAIAAAGKLYLGPDDLSFEHDRYLAGSYIESEREHAG